MLGCLESESGQWLPGCLLKRGGTRFPGRLHVPLQLDIKIKIVFGFMAVLTNNL